MANKYQSFLDLVPESQLKLQQMSVVVDEHGAVLPTYKFRKPPTLHDLQQLNGLWSIWQENQTLIVTDNPAEIEVRSLSYLDRQDSKKGYTSFIDLADDERFLWFSAGSLRFTIVGTSDHAIAETATFLWELLDNIHARDISCTSRREFNFGVFSLEQLAVLFRTHQNAQIELDVSSISPMQSEFMAQLPYPISLYLQESFDSFSDGGNTFVESLLRRDSSFGSLKLWRVLESQSDTFQRLLQAKAIEKVELRVGTPNQIRQLLAASVKCIRILCEGDDLWEVDWSSVYIIPKELSLDLDLVDEEDHTDSLCSFLRRLAELGDFVKLEFTFWFPEVPTRVAEELIHTVAANQGLKELHLCFVLHKTGAKLQDVFTTIGRHKTLRCLKIDEYPTELDSSYAMLKQLLKQNRNIEVVDSAGKRVTDGDTIDQLYAFNQFFWDSQGLRKETLSIMSALVCEALIHSAGNDFQRSALLMADHTSALCEVVQYSFISPQIES
jgi:hypothetical protein